MYLDLFVLNTLIHCNGFCWNWKMNVWVCGYIQCDMYSISYAFPLPNVSIRQHQWLCWFSLEWSDSKHPQKSLKCLWHYFTIRCFTWLFLLPWFLVFYWLDFLCSLSMLYSWRMCTWLAYPWVHWSLQPTPQSTNIKSRASPSCVYQVSSYIVHMSCNIPLTQPQLASFHHSPCVIVHLATSLQHPESDDLSLV